MVKRTPRPEPQPVGSNEPKGVAAPTKKPRNTAKKAPAQQAGDLSREAMADDTKAPLTSQQASQPDKVPAGGWGIDPATPIEGDRRHDEEHNIDLVFYKGKWVPAAPPKIGDKARINGVDSTWDGHDWAPGDLDKGSSIGWGLDGTTRVVDEEGKDASEAGKVAEATKAKGPRVRKSKAQQEEERGVNLTGMAKDLVDGVERIERLAEERAALGDDIKEVFAELKAKGYSSPILRKVLSRRQMDPEKRKEQDDMLALYEEALK